MIGKVQVVSTLNKHHSNAFVLLAHIAISRFS